MANFYAFEAIGKVKTVRYCKQCGSRFAAKNANRHYCTGCRS